MDMKVSEEAKKELPEYTEMTKRADAFIIVAPEYNHSIPGSLKMLLDSVEGEYSHKPVGICGVSSGSFGGSRMVEHFIPVLRELGLVAIFSALYASSVKTMFNEDGELQDDKFNERIDKFMDDLLWNARTLKWGRENL